MSETLPSPEAPYAGEWRQHDPGWEAEPDPGLDILETALAAGSLSPDELSAPSGVALVVSYAAPDVVRQAKLEALELKVRQKMNGHWSSLRDPYEMRGPDPEPDTATLRAACAARALPGGRDQIAALVVPPALGEHGELVAGSSELVLGGERLEYQCPFADEPAAAAGAAAAPGARAGAVSAASAGGRRAGGAPRAPTQDVSGAAVTMPRYRTADVTAKLDAAVGLLAAGGRSTRRRELLRGGEGAESRRGREQQQQRQQRGGAAAQLSEGMLTFVAARAERPKGVGRTAFVPQAQALHEAEQDLRATRKQRPSSAPQRRQSPSQAGAGAGAGAGPALAASRDGGKASGGGSGGQAGCGGSGGAGGGGGGVGRDGVPIARAEETDLLAEQLQRSSRLTAALHSGALERLAAIARHSGPHSGPHSPLAAAPQGPRAAQPAARSVSFSAAQATVLSGQHGRARALGAAGTLVAGPAGGAKSAGAAPHPDPATALEAAAAAARADLSRRGHAAMAPGSERQASAAKQRGRGGEAGVVPASPFMDRAVAAAAVAAAAASAGPSLTPTRSRAAGGGGGDGGHSSAPAVARPTSAAGKRREPLSGAAAAAAAQQSARPWVQQGAPPSARQRTPSRPSTQYPASPSAHSGSATTASTASSCAPESPRSGTGRQSAYQPLEVEARRQRQGRPGSAIGTAKTNGRIRGLAAAAQSGSFGGGAPVAALAAERSSASSGASVHAAGPWVTAASTSFPGAGSPSERAQLQARILDGLARRHQAGPASASAAAEDNGDDEGPAAASVPEELRESETGSWSAPRRRSRMGSAPEAVASAPAAAHAGAGGAAGKAGTAAALAAAAAAPLAPQGSAGELGSGEARRSRPLSGSSRRVRQLMYGSWVGSRPEAGPGLSGQHSATGLVYDPEAQPSPLDSYMSRLVGLD